MASTAVRCRYCESRHAPRWLCDPAKKTLDALYARGMSFNMPNLEFPEPIPGAAMGLGQSPDDALVAQLVVKAAAVDVAGVARAAFILSGRRADGAPLPNWLYVGTDDEMDRAVALVTDMADLGKRSAARARGEAQR